MLTLKQANRGVELQRRMDNRTASIFARALPRDGADLDTDSIRAFEQYVREHPDMADALNFMHEALSPSHLVRALSAESTLEARLCGL